MLKRWVELGEIRQPGAPQSRKNNPVDSNGNIQSYTSEQPGSPLERKVSKAFLRLIGSEEFPCLGARAVAHSGQYRFGIYRKLGSEKSTRKLSHDLSRFIEEQETFSEGFSSFIAVFTGEQSDSELYFERKLWEQLQSLHNIDPKEYDPSVAMHPDENNFAFSFLGRAFFIVGLHPASSRIARKFPWAALVFNAHAQFRKLRDEGHFQKLRDMVRGRDLALQGTLNPNLSDFGQASEARQYSGRAVEPNWKCPFHPLNDTNQI